MTGGQALVAQLVREGVTHVFGLPGDQTDHCRCCGIDADEAGNQNRGSQGSGDR